MASSGNTGTAQAHLDVADVQQRIDAVLRLDAGRADLDAVRTALFGLIHEMAADGHRRSDPVREIFARLGDKWSMLLLLLLRAGSMRHSILRRLAGTIGADEKISQRILTLRLRTLERDGLIARSRIDGAVPRVEYSLTPMGRDLLLQIDGLFAWVRRHSPAILAAHSRFDDSEAAPL